MKAVEQNVAQRESEVIVAENRLLDASLYLRALIGERYESGQTLGVVPTAVPEAFVTKPVDVDAAIDLAMTNDPRVQQLQLALASRRIDEVVTSWRVYGTPTSESTASCPATACETSRTSNTSPCTTQARVLD